MVCPALQEARRKSELTYNPILLESGNRRYHQPQPTHQPEEDSGMPRLPEKIPPSLPRHIQDEGGTRRRQTFPMPRLQPTQRLLLPRNNHKKKKKEKRRR